MLSCFGKSVYSNCRCERSQAQQSRPENEHKSSCHINPHCIRDLPWHQAKKDEKVEVWNLSAALQVQALEAEVKSQPSSETLMVPAEST